MKGNRLLLFIIFLSTISFVSFGQKIKYKDLFYLLNAQKYEEAEPFLKSFLKNPKEADNPNANFQMAVIYGEKYKTKDLLASTNEKIVFIDSAIHYYNLAKTLIDEKEIKRNSEYYEDYYRRDLRTGKMGIKISDILLDIDARITSLDQDKLNISNVASLFAKTQNFYSQAQSGYVELVAKYANQKQFFLQSNHKLIKELGQIKINYDSAMGCFGKYKIVLQEINSSGYNQTLNVEKINDIKDPLIEPDFLESSIKIYDFENWVLSTIDIIKNELIPLHEKLLEYDANLNLLYKKVMIDSNSVIQDLDKMNSTELVQKLNKFDDFPFPVLLFALKKNELLFYSLFVNNNTIDLIDSKNQIGEELLHINRIDSIVTLCKDKFDYSVEAKNYSLLFTERYGGVEGVKKFIEEKQTLVAENKKPLEEKLSLLEEKSKWLYYGADSIPLLQFDAIANNGNSNRLYYFLGKQQVNDTVQFAFGMEYNSIDSANVYFSEITPTQIVNEIIKVKANAKELVRDSVLAIKYISTLDKQSNTYILVFNNKYNNTPMDAHLVRVNSDLSIEWDKNVNLLYPPDVLTVSEDYGVLAINYDVKYIDKANGLQLISRILFKTTTGDPIDDKN